jgi:hypothetical protein
MDLGQKFLVKISNAKIIVEKWFYFKIKSFSTARVSMTRVKRQPTEQGKILKIHISDKGLISKMY